jgi:putative FmdB family regulatory protein
MPVYEYLCQPCDTRFERYVRAWGEVVHCPHCAGEVEKQLSTFALAVSAGAARPAAVPSAGGACCGGGCGCAH